MEPFDRNKVREGVERACWKRPVRDSQISELVAELETRIEGELEISTQEIGEMTMQLLRRLDEVAYVRFASVYHKFDTIKDFRNAISNILADRPMDTDQ